MSVRVSDSGPAANRLDEILDALRGVRVYVGIRAEKGADLVTYAAANEFGVPPHLPSRSFLRSTAREQREKWAGMMRDAAGQVIDGASPAVVFGRVGLTAAADVQRKIIKLRIPPNAPSTIRRKGSDNPLYDTGRMVGSIDYHVVAPGVGPMRGPVVPTPRTKSLDIGGEMAHLARGGGG